MAATEDRARCLPRASGCRRCSEAGREDSAMILSDTIRKAGSLPMDLESKERRIRSALLCHVQHRWYLGEMICHASWLGCFERAAISRVSICTNPHYQEIFKGHPAMEELIGPDDLDEALL